MATYFTGTHPTMTRHQTIGTAVRSINSRIATGSHDVPVWVGGCYGPPVVTINAPVTTLALAALIKAAHKQSA